MNKNENPDILSYLVKFHTADNYSDHLKLFTEGSVIKNDQASTGIVLPEFKTEKKASTYERESLYLLQKTKLVQSTGTEIRTGIIYQYFIEVPAF